MYLLFMDESGNPSLGAKTVSEQPCVIAGLAVPDGAWAPINNHFRLIKAKYKVGDELKWRNFASGQRGPLAHLDRKQKDALRAEIYGLVTRRNAIRIIAVIGTPSVYATQGIFRSDPDGFYQHASSR
jgi:hypothetical protein